MDTPQAVQPATDAPGGVATPQVSSLLDPRHWFRAPEPGNPPGCQACGFALLHPIHRRDCFRCSRDLTPTQHRWCSRACGAAYHDALHPRVNPAGKGLRADGSIEKRYLGLMQDGEWRTDAQAALVLQENESVVGRKRRLLTAKRHPFESRRLGGPQTPAQYRLLEPSAQADPVACAKEVIYYAIGGAPKPWWKG